MDTIRALMLADVLKTCCRKNQQGFAVYKLDWDDKKVYAAVAEKNTTGKPISMAQVYKMRSDLYGKLAPKPAAKNALAVDGAVMRKVTARLAALEKKIELLEDTINRIDPTANRIDPTANRIDPHLNLDHSNRRPRSCPDAKLMELPKK